LILQGVGRSTLFSKSFLKYGQKGGRHPRNPSLIRVLVCSKFPDTIEANFSEGSFGERKQRLIEHFLTRTSSERPLCVRSVSNFADLDQIVLGEPQELHTISMFIGYVQMKASQKSVMTNFSNQQNGNQSLAATKGV
jgi:hypothetical protein